MDANDKNIQKAKNNIQCTMTHKKKYFKTKIKEGGKCGKNLSKFK